MQGSDKWFYLTLITFIVCYTIAKFLGVDLIE